MLDKTETAPSIKPVRLVITDKFYLNNVDFGSMAVKEITIRCLTEQEAFDLIHCKEHHIEYYLTLGICKMAVELLLKCEIKSTVKDKEIPVINDDIIYLIVGFDYNLNPVFYEVA